MTDRIVVSNQPSPELKQYTAYDQVAWFYNRYWGRDYPPRACSS
jgi:hypothetical protein